MLTILLFSIPLSSYITLSVVAMILWVFFVMTKLQIDTASSTTKRTARPEPTPFSFFKPGDNPTPIIPPSTLSPQELAISVNIDKGRAARNKPAPDKPTVVPEKLTPVASEQPTEPNSVNASQNVPAPVVQSTAPVVPPVTNPNPDFAEADEPTDFALYQTRQVSVVANPPLLGIIIDTKPGETAESTHEQLNTLNGLQTEADERVLNRKRKTEQLMRLAAGLDFEAYVKLFRAYYEQAMAGQKAEPERALYVLFAELIADETADVQEQLLMLLDKEATSEEPEGLMQAEVYTDEQIEEVEPAFT
ncbi:hypothetical protein [uncultured Fibrella sp.]|uniref:hypothetical protein n=1 Tax=uncultured Fibrella sp. TaxID=1284596 RepID=UPI0035C9F1F1